MDTNDRFIRFSIATDTILKNIQKYKNDRLASFGLRSMHLMFLYCLDKAENGLTPVELAKTCSVDKALISRISTELRDKGYVAYADGENCELSHYKRRITLTEAGRNVMDVINSMISDSVDRIASGVSGEQLETFYAVLAMFAENLGSLAGAEA